MDRIQLEEYTIHNLREIGRRYGVKSPASLKRVDLIQQILDIIDGKLSPVTATRGRPTKIRYSENSFLPDMSAFSTKPALHQSTVGFYNDAFKKIEICKQYVLSDRPKVIEEINIYCPIAKGQSVSVCCSDNRVKNLAFYTFVKEFEKRDDVFVVPVLYNATIDDLHYLNEKSKKNCLMTDIINGDKMNVSITQDLVDIAVDRCRKSENVVIVLDLDKLAQTLKLISQPITAIKIELIKKLISLAGNYHMGTITLFALTKGEEYFSTVADIFKTQINLNFPNGELRLDTVKSYTLNEEMFIENEKLDALKKQRVTIV